jgi:hypothetical protein
MLRECLTQMKMEMIGMMTGRLMDCSRSSAWKAIAIDRPTKRRKLGNSSTPIKQFRTHGFPGNIEIFMRFLQGIPRKLPIFEVIETWSLRRILALPVPRISFI